MKKIYPFNIIEQPALDQVGGKALSLIAMTKEGMPVPRGFVLTVSFFEPWITFLHDTNEWELLQESNMNHLGSSARALQSLCKDLHMNEEQQSELESAMQDLNSDLFAVRSSSPEEDIEDASFAGSYESILGVNAEGIEEAIRRVFTSCFDERVFLYKKQHNFSMDQLRIAVIVQEQIDTDSAGVGFSLNPVNNCFDEAVIIANYGLGESVVSGQVSPDTFIVDKITGTIINTKIGKKESVIKLVPGGGTLVAAQTGLEQKTCITPDQVITLTNLLTEIEMFYDAPVDIEWAFSKGSLYLLQARLITTYLPLPPEMVTEPGHPKQLYADATLIEQGIEDPLSVLGTDFLTYILQQMSGPLGGNVIGTDGIAFTAGGRYYLRLSYTIPLLGRKAALAPGNPGDPTVNAILDNIDLKQYIPKKLPKKLRGTKRKMIFSMIPFALSVIKAYRNPNEFLRVFKEGSDHQRSKIYEIPNRDMNIENLAIELTDKLYFFIMKNGIPMMLVPQLALSRIKRIFKREINLIQNELACLGMALPGNKTTQMGDLMYRLASFDAIKQSNSLEGFLIQLEQRSLNSEFLQAWDLYIKEFGFRCFREIDVATPRPNEQPSLLYKQLKTLSLAVDARKDDKTVLQEALLKRETSYQKLFSMALKKGKRQANAFAKYYETYVMLAGYREIGKYYITMVIDLFRKRIIQVAQNFVDSGRLDNLEQIFDLRIEDIDNALIDNSLDLRKLATDNARLLARIKMSKLVPQLIDSRGKIFYPPRKDPSNGELVGEPISPGVVQGQVKVFHTYGEKTLLPGEILVARSTDPGWTPLFINAKGIILEIGGVLQHGAVVAREYGIPCVSGIEGIVHKLKDGQMVEVDGSNGIVRMLDSVKSKGSSQD